jgi:hypothetical protein
MLEEKRLEQEDHMKVKIHPNPIPPSVLEPRYEKIIL